MEVMKLVEYRSDFMLWSFVSLMWTVFNFFFLSLLFQINDTVAGWTKHELYVLLSVYTMLDAFTWSVFYPNMTAYTDKVFSGELAQFLVKPVNTIFLLLSSNSNLHNLPRFVIGSAMLWYSLRQLGSRITIPSFIHFIIFFSTSLIFMYALWFIFATGAFWVERLSNINEIVPGFRRLYQFPRTIYTGIFGAIVSFVIPVALVTTIPTEQLLSRDSGIIMVYFAFYTLLLCMFAIKFFSISVRRFASTGG